MNLRRGSQGWFPMIFCVEPFCSGDADVEGSIRRRTGYPEIKNTRENAPDNGRS